MHVKEWCTKPCVLGTFGLILAGFGTLFIIFWAELFEQQLANELKLRPGSRTYEAWKSPPIPMSLDIYLWNWTNPEDFLNTTTKPIFVECGPYVFIEEPDKVNVTWHPENSTVSYMKKSRFFFDEERSGGSLDDVITSLNIVSLGAAESVRHQNFYEKTKVSLGLSMYKQEIAVTKLAREFLFEGYEDELVNAAKAMPFLTEGKNIPFDRVGWFYMRNDTAELTGVFNAHTGEKDISQLGQLKNWNYVNRTTFFRDHCGIVNGSAGELYPPKVTKDRPVAIFTPDLCRSLPMDFEKEEMVGGLLGYKFSGGERAVDNGTKYPETWCFSGEDAIPSGVLNISACRYDTPVFMSYPHFYAADEFYLNQVEGMEPDVKKHQFFMTFEPTLGIPLDVAARLQLNVLIRPVEGVSMYADVPEVYFPIMWFEQRVTVLPELAKEIKQVHIVPLIGYCVLGLLIICGVVMILWYPMTTLLCGKRFEASGKATAPVPPTTQVSSVSDGQDSEIPLMFKDPSRRPHRDVEQPAATKQYNFERDPAERFS